MLIVTTTVYNHLDYVKDTVESVLENTRRPFRYYLVYNHPPGGEETLKYLRDLELEYPDKIFVVDPGKNTGCHNGINLGWKVAIDSDYYNKNSDNIKYLCKLDDDTVVTKGWEKHTIAALKAEPRLAYIAPDCNAKQSTDNQVVHYKNGVVLELPKAGIVGFSCVIVPLKTYNEFGPLRARFINASGNLVNEGLYGGEEAYYAQCAIERNLLIGYASKAYVHHQDNETRDLDYVMWKYWYGYLGKTNQDFCFWKDNKEDKIKAYTWWAERENNDWYRLRGLQALERIKDEV